MGRALPGEHAPHVLPVPGRLLVWLSAARTYRLSAKTECPCEHVTISARRNRACARWLLFYLQVRNTSRRRYHQLANRHWNDLSLLRWFGVSRFCDLFLLCAKDSKRFCLGNVGRRGMDSSPSCDLLRPT